MIFKFFFFFLCVLIQCNSYANYSYSVHPKGKHDWDPQLNVILEATERRPARTAVLIIAPPNFGNDFTGRRWKLGQKVWEKYMHAVPDVDCYFLQSASPRSGHTEQVWLEGNTIYVGDPWYAQHGEDRILNKTIAAIEFLLPYYTHFVRTNINSFFNLKSVSEYCETHHQNMYTGPIWQGEWYVLGYGILFTADVAEHIANEYRRLEGLDIVSNNRSDDCVLTSLATGVYPLNDAEHQFECSTYLPFGVRQLMSWESFSSKRLSEYGALLLPPISLEQAIKYCDKAPSTLMLYRIREGLDLSDLAQLYQYLLHKIYPELTPIDLSDYVNESK